MNGLSAQNPNYLPMVAGRYYFVPNATSTGTNGALGNGTLIVIGHYIPNPITLTKIGAEVTSASASTKFRLGIYADDGGVPGALVVDAGQIDGGSATVQEATISVSLVPGWYWFGGAVQDAAGTQPTMRTCTSLWNPHPIGGAAPSAGAVIGGWAVGSVTGALPSTFGAGSRSGACPRIFIKT